MQAGSVHENRLHPFLKVEMLKYQNHPDRATLREVTFLMDDMLHALELGRVQLTPRAKQSIYGSSNLVNLKGRRIVKSEAKRLKEKLEDEDSKKQREKEFKIHTTKVKMKLEKMRYEQIELQRKKDELKREELRAKRQKDLNKEAAKRKFYEQVAQDYEKRTGTLKEEEKAKAAEDKERQDKEKEQRKAENQQQLKAHREKLLVELKKQELDRRLAGLAKDEAGRRFQRKLKEKTEKMLKPDRLPVQMGYLAGSAS